MEWATQGLKRGEAGRHGEQQTFEGLVLGHLGHHTRGDSYKRLLRYSGFFQGKDLGDPETASQTSLTSMSSGTELSAAETSWKFMDEPGSGHASLASTRSPPSARKDLDVNEEATRLSRLQMQDSDHSSSTCEDVLSPQACGWPATSAQDSGCGACLHIGGDWPYVLLDANPAAKELFGDFGGKSVRVLLGPESDSDALRRLVEDCKAAEDEGWGPRSVLALYNVYGEELNLLGSCALEMKGGQRCVALSLVTQEVEWGWYEDPADDNPGVGSCVVAPIAPFVICSPNLDLLSLVGWMEKDIVGSPLSLLWGQADASEWTEMIEAATRGVKQAKQLRVCNAFGLKLDCAIEAEPFTNKVKLLFRAGQNGSGVGRERS